jgi:membrane protein
MDQVSSFISAQGSKPEEVSSLYVLKALLAFVVVACHAPLLLPWFNLPGITVELFFSITGYFLYTFDLGKVQSRVKKSAKKVIPIIVVLQLFYTLIYPPKLGPITTSYWRYIQWLFLGFNNFVTGHLWYLTALLLGLISFAGYLKAFQGRYITWLFLLVIPGALIGPFRPLLFGQPESLFVFNFLTRAVPFLAMGYWIRAHEEYLLAFRWINIYAGLLVLSGAEYLFTAVLSGGVAEASLTALFPLNFAAFMLFLSYKSLGKGTWLETIGKKYSGNIYYFHIAIIVGWKALKGSSPVLASIYEKGGAFVVFFLSLGVAYLIVKLQDRLGYHLLK